LLNDRLEHAINHANRFNQCIAVIFCDLDNFKPINDTYGHSVGDEVLKEVAGAFREILRKEDTICRFGGDEFVILIEELKSFEYLQGILEKLRTISERMFIIDNIRLQVGMSIGASLYPNDATSPEMLLDRADKAMYKAKHGGKNKIAYYQPDASAYCANPAYTI